MMRRICVFCCPSTGTRESYRAAAIKLAREIAARKLADAAAGGGRMVIAENASESLVERLINYKVPQVGKWMGLSET